MESWRPALAVPWFAQERWRERPRAKIKTDMRFFSSFILQYFRLATLLRRRSNSLPKKFTLSNAGVLRSKIQKSPDSVRIVSIEVGNEANAHQDTSLRFIPRRNHNHFTQCGHTR